MADKKIVKLHSDEEVISSMVERKTSSMFGGIDAYINAQADHLIHLAKHGTISDFTTMRPINPSVVHCALQKLLS